MMMMAARTCGGRRAAASLRRGLATYPRADAPGTDVDEDHWRVQYTVDKTLRNTKPMCARELRAAERVRFNRFEDFKEEAAQAGLKVDVMASAVVERLPVIMHDLEDWEVDMFELKEEKELYTKKEYPKEFWTHRERPIQKQNLWAYDLLDWGTNGRLGKSSINDELRKELEPMLEEYRKDEAQRIADLEEAELKRRGLVESDSDASAGQGDIEGSQKDGGLDVDPNLDLSRDLDFDISQVEVDIDEDVTQEIEYSLAVDIDDASGIGSQQDFRPEPRITIEDKIHDTRSLRRRLQRRLHLLVKVQDPENPNGEPVWRYPFGLRNEDEEYFEAAKRHTLEQCGTDLDLYMLGRIPAGYTWYKYSEAEQQERSSYGALVLFYRSQRIAGHVELSSKVQDYVWISNDELDQIVPNAAEDPYWSYGRHFMDA